MLPTRQTQVRFLRFFTVGGTAYVVNIASFAVLKRVLPANAAFSTAFVLSTVTHYSLNRFWALPSLRRDTGRQLAEYIATCCLSYLISYAAFKFFSLVAGFNLTWSQALSVPPATVVVFGILNYRVFRHPLHPDPRPES